LIGLILPPEINLKVKHMRKLFLLTGLFVASFSLLAQGLKFTQVNPANKQVTIKNFGAATVDISNYHFCSLFDYTQPGSGIAGQSTIITGSLNLTPGAEVTLTWNNMGGGMNPNGADMCLYLNNSCSNPASMVDFVQWGSAGNGREGVANTAGLWVAGTFVTGPAPYTYTGNGTQSGVGFWQNASPPPPTTTIVINEVDADQPSTDTMEFVELYGPPGESLDGMVLVFFNGSPGSPQAGLGSYLAINLTGHSLNSEGFIVVGNPGVSQASINFPNNTLQNGEDAVALYFGTAAQWPNGTIATDVNLIDALVYSNNTNIATGLINILLNPGQLQINENGSGNGTTHSMSRVPDGGIQRNTNTYVTQLPTPGASNMPAAPSCAGGTVASATGQTTVNLCSEENSNIVFFEEMATIGDEYAFVVTTTTNTIIAFVAGNNYDFGGEEEGLYRVWGLAYNGVLNSTTIQPGQNASDITSTDDCVSLSSNFIAVAIQSCSTGGSGCGNLFFSEYLEGTSNNKALEIYNPTGVPVDLSQYSVHLFANGNTNQTNSITLSGTLAPQDVYVIAHPSAMASILALADITSNVTNFNGNDAVVLRQNGVDIDIVGIVGNDPGTEWIVGSGSTSDNTLVRKPEIYEGTTNWAESVNQWIVFPVNTISNLGSHDAEQCTTDPIIGFAATSISVNENAGTIEIFVSILNPGEEDYIVEVSITGGTATEGEDFTSNLPVQLTFPAGSTDPQSFAITIIDDEDEEGSEIIVLGLTDVLGNAILGTTEMTITINPSDIPTPLYDIIDVRGVNAQGVADSLNVFCELRGVVYGVNLRPQGLEFTLIDHTSGVGVFLTSGNLGYTVQETDSIHVVGTIVQFNGLIQINPTSIELISTGNQLKEPSVVTALGESTESDLIRLNCVKVNDPIQWTNAGAGFNVAVTDGTNTYTLRVDADTDVFGTPVPVGSFTLIGIGSQFDSSSPFTSGYQIIPRYIADIQDPISAGFDAPVLITNQEPTATFTATGNASGYEWDFGDGTIEEGDEVTHTYTEPFIQANNTVTVTLTVVNEDGTCSVSQSVSVEMIYVGIKELDAKLLVYPNPVKGLLFVESDVMIRHLVLTGLAGQVVRPSVSISHNRAEINASELAAGVYFLHIQTDMGSIVRKAVVE
jgi:hypothetical protein